MPKSKTRKPKRRVKPSAAERAERRAAREARARRAGVAQGGRLATGGLIGMEYLMDMPGPSIPPGFGGPPPAAGAASIVVTYDTPGPTLEQQATLAHLERFRTHRDLILRDPRLR